MRPLLLHTTIGASLLTLCLLPTAYSQGQVPVGTNATGPLSQYKSRPDIYAPFLNISIFDEEAVTPGYIFLAPYQTFQDSVYIYDNRGNLVYSGFGSTGGGASHNFHLCSINGTDNLCYTAAEPTQTEEAPSATSSNAGVNMQRRGGGVTGELGLAAVVGVGMGTYVL